MCKQRSCGLKGVFRYRVKEYDSDGALIFNSCNCDEVLKHLDLSYTAFFNWKNGACAYHKLDGRHIEIIDREPVTLYMVVTRDKYELPLFVGTIEEVARFRGTTVNSIRSALTHGRAPNYRRVLVFMNDDEDESEI